MRRGGGAIEMNLLLVLYEGQHGSPWHSLSRVTSLDFSPHLDTALTRSVRFQQQGPL